MITPLFVTSVIKNSAEIVRDHCHLSGKFRGAAHEVCNLKYKVPTFSQLYFTICLAMIVTYLLEHLEIAKETFHVYQIMRKTTFLSRSKSSLTNFVNKEGKKVNVKRELRFIDSMRFMASSLDKLYSNLKIDQFVNLKKYYSDNQLSLLLRKDVYPYDYVDCMKKLHETRLPPKEAFYSKLTGECITDEDYQHAQTVWKELILGQ